MFLLVPNYTYKIQWLFFLFLMLLLDCYFAFFTAMISVSDLFFSTCLLQILDNWKYHKSKVASYWLVKLDSTKQRKVSRGPGRHRGRH